MWKQRYKKFLDNPLVVLTFLRTRLYYTLIADRVSAGYHKFHFLNGRETIAQITEKDMSIIRSGDGTFGYLLGSSIYFNDWHFKYDRSFAKKLENVMQNGQDENILFCYPHTFVMKTKEEFEQENIGAEWKIWVTKKVLLKKYLHTDKSYGDALCFHPRYNPDIDFLGIKQYLDTKHIVIITSNTARFNNIKLGKSTTLIEGPSSDAWRIYNELEEKALAAVASKELQKHEVLFMISAAEAAKVMVYDLTVKGYTAWDTGQFFDLAAKEIVALSADPAVQ